MIHFPNKIMLIPFLIVFVIGLIKHKPVVGKNVNNTKVLQFPMASVILLLYLVNSFDDFLFWVGEIFYLSCFLNIVEFVCLAFLAVMLLIKKRNKFLLLPIAILTLLHAYYSIVYDEDYVISNLLLFAAYAFMLVLVFSINKTEEKHNILSEMCKKYYYVPAILLVIELIISVVDFSSQEWVREILNSWYYSFGDKLGYYADFVINDVIFVGFVLLFNCWLVNPYKKEIVRQSQEVFSDTSKEYYENSANNDIAFDEAYCGLGKHIVLCLFTFGIWYLIWTYRTTKFLNKTPGAEQYNPTNKLLLCIFVPFYQIYWMYKHGERIDTFSKYKKLSNSDMATMCLILGIFIPIVACILMQDRINALCMAKTPMAEEKAEIKKQNAPTQVVAETSAADELKKFKNLLDSGVITQEEFDAKKKQLLGL